MRLHVALTPELKHWVLGFGAQVTVIAPEELRQQIIGEVDKLAQVYDLTLTAKSKAAAKTTMDGIKSFGKKTFSYFESGHEAVVATLSRSEILKWTEALSKAPATIYDKAMDSEYLKTHIGGGHHRLFDGGHTLYGAWEHVKHASNTDTFTQEVLGYFEGLWKDVTTREGLPFVTLTQAEYKEWVDAISHWIPGISRDYLYDMLSFNATELFSAALTTVSIVFCFSKDDREKLARMLGSMSLSSVASANPIMMFLVVSTLAYAYFVKKQKLDKEAFAKGSAVSGVSAVLYSVLGLPFIFEIVIVMVVTHLLKKHVLDDREMMTLIRQNLERIGSDGITASKKSFEELTKAVSDFFADIKKKTA